MGISLSFVAVCSARVDHLLSGQAPLMLTIGTQDTDVPPQMVQDFYEDFVSEKGMLLCLYSGIYLGFGRCEKPPPSHAELISRRGVHNRRCGPSCETANNKRRGSLEYRDCWTPCMEQGPFTKCPLHQYVFVGGSPWHNRSSALSHVHASPFLLPPPPPPPPLYAITASPLHLRPLEKAR